MKEKNFKKKSTFWSRKGKQKYYLNREETLLKAKAIRLEFNKTLPPLNLICAYCNKTFTLPGIQKNGRKQSLAKYCSYVCAKRKSRFNKLWVPKWLYNYYLDKKLFRLVASYKMRKNWNPLTFRCRKFPIDKIFKKLKKIFISNYNHKPIIYQRTKEFFFHRTVTKEGVFTYKLKTWRRFLFGRERTKCLFCQRSIVHLAKDANYCNHNNQLCYRKHTHSVNYSRPLLSVLLGKYNYISLKRKGIINFLSPNINTLKKWKEHKIKLRFKISILNYIIISPFINFYYYLFFKCRWCRTPLEVSSHNHILYCNNICKTGYKKYSKRLFPIWFYKNIYTPYNLYKIRWQYYPKIKNFVIFLYIKIITFSKKKIKNLKKVKVKKQNRSAICKHCQQEFKWEQPYTDKRTTTRNFCGKNCQTLFKQKTEQNKIQRNIDAWGTEFRPDKTTRKHITREKHRLWEKNKKKTDPAFKLLKRMRTRTRKVLKGIYKEGKKWNGEKLNIFEKLGIKSGQELRDHIETQWQEGMNWDNYGSGKGFWVVDHDTPIAYYKNNFDLLNDLQIQRKCFGKENLKPMWWVDNAHKGAKLDYNGFK